MQAFSPPSSPFNRRDSSSSSRSSDEDNEYVVSTFLLFERTFWRMLSICSIRSYRPPSKSLKLNYIERRGLTNGYSEDEEEDDDDDDSSVHAPSTSRSNGSIRNGENAHSSRA